MGGKNKLGFLRYCICWHLVIAHILAILCISKMLEIWYISRIDFVCCIRVIVAVLLLPLQLSSPSFSLMKLLSPL